MSYKEIRQTPTITAGAYSAADAVGGLLTFADVGVGYQGDVKITKVIVIDDAAQAAALDLWLYSEEFTPSADNAAFSPSDADNQHCVAVVHIAAADYGSGDDNSVAHVECDLPVTLSGISAGSGGLYGLDLYGQLTCLATPTFAATDDLTIVLVVQV
jgi:hypothetical protein